MTGMTARRLRVLLVCVAFALVTASAVSAHAEWGSAEVQLTTNDQPQWSPDVSGDWVVYEDRRDPAEYGEVDDPDQLFEIRAINVKTMATKKITPKKTSMWEPAVAGNYVVWPDYGNGSTTKGIWYHNLKTGTHKRLPVNKGTDVELSGHRMVYSYGGDIYTYNLWTGKHIKVTDNDKSHSPDISGTKIVYGYYTGTLNFDIYVYDLATGIHKRLTSDAVNRVSKPAIAGDTVVWVDDRNGNDDIYAYNLKTNTETRLTHNVQDQGDPAISGNWVVYSDDRSGTNQIYLYDLLTGTERRLTNTATYQSHAAIAGGNVAYMDSRNGYDIYFTKIATPQMVLAAPPSPASNVPATVTGTLKTNAGVAIEGAPVTLETSKDQKTWTTCDSTLTVTGGAFTMHTPGFTTRRYVRARFGGQTSEALPPYYRYPPATSNTRLVKAIIGLTGAPRFKTYALKYGTTYKAWGYFVPKHASGSTQMRLKAYRWNGSSWVYKRSYTTRVSNPSGSAYSKFTGYVRLPSKGSWRVRIYHVEDRTNAKTHGPYRYVTVK